jgi:IS5 family transposase
MAKKRESHYVTIARIAYRLAQAKLPKYTHPNSPKRFTQPQLAACVVLMAHLGLSYRDMEEWLLASDQVCAVLELSDVPDHSTLNRTMKRLRMKGLAALNEELLRRLGVDEEFVAIDSTGYPLTQASQHFITRRGQSYSHYVKGFYAVGINSQLILAWGYDLGPGSDMPYLNGLRRAARPFGKPTAHPHGHQVVPLADRGFDGRQVQAGDLIPPRRTPDPTRPLSPHRQARADLVDAARLDGLMGHRWKAETVISVIKRTSGDAIRSRLPLHRRREVALKGLAYNVHV